MKFNGEKLKDERTRLQMTQRRLADLLNVTPQTISLMETETIVPTMKRVSQLCEVFRRPIGFFFDRDVVHSKQKSTGTA